MKFFKIFFNKNPVLNAKHPPLTNFSPTFTNFSHFFSIISKPSWPKISCPKIITTYITTAYKKFKQTIIHNQKNKNRIKNALIGLKTAIPPKNQILLTTFLNYFNIFKTKNLHYTYRRSKIRRSRTQFNRINITKSKYQLLDKTEAKTVAVVQ